jgi:hypothetical protein
MIALLTLGLFTNNLEYILKTNLQNAGKKKFIKFIAKRREK